MVTGWRVIWVVLFFVEQPCEQSNGERGHGGLPGLPGGPLGGAQVPGGGGGSKHPHPRLRRHVLHPRRRSDGAPGHSQVAGKWTNFLFEARVAALTYKWLQRAAYISMVNKTKDFLHDNIKPIFNVGYAGIRNNMSEQHYLRGNDNSSNCLLGK